MRKVKGLRLAYQIVYEDRLSKARGVQLDTGSMLVISWGIFGAVFLISVIARY